MLYSYIIEQKILASNIERNSILGVSNKVYEKYEVQNKEEQKDWKTKVDAELVDF